MLAWRVGQGRAGWHMRFATRDSLLVCCALQGLAHVQVEASVTQPEKLNRWAPLAGPLQALSKPPRLAIKGQGGFPAQQVAALAQQHACKCSLLWNATPCPVCFPAAATQPDTFHPRPLSRIPYPLLLTDISHFPLPAAATSPTPSISSSPSTSSGMMPRGLTCRPSRLCLPQVGGLVEGATCVAGGRWAEWDRR